MRYERKFSFGNCKENTLKSYLLNKNFREIFPSRYVSSIYYDTNDFINYHESKEGLYERRKIRIRFYNDNINSNKLEYKYKKGDVGFKKTENNSSEEINSYEIKINNPISKDNILVTKIPNKIENRFIPTLLVSYKRFYFLSSCKKIRATVDTDLNFCKLRSLKNYKKTNLNLKYHKSILEIKYKINFVDNKLIESITNDHNVFLSRFSKYCTGIEICF